MSFISLTCKRLILALPQRCNTASGLRGGGLLVACSFTFEVGGPSSSPPPPWSLMTAPQSWLCPSQANTVDNLSGVLDNAENDVLAYHIASNGLVLGASHWFLAPPLLVAHRFLRPLVLLEWLVECLSLHLQMLQGQPFPQARCVSSSASVSVVSHQNASQEIVTYLLVWRCSDGMLHVTSSLLT